ncbi:MAG TPA: glutamine synthetase beta-grasp domain-containing protein, partial [Anaerolineales bacterium]|nr:glutamine synthetase beta-grasp domain-containing protein [Anaerolineales bacterium]
MYPHPKLRPVQEIAELTYPVNGRKNGSTPPILTPDVERCTTPREVVQYARKRGLQIVDYKFTDLLGRWHHFSMPIRYLAEDVFEEGLGFDGSSIRAFQDIHESDMLLMPDPATAIVDPMLEIPTLNILCNIRDPVSGAPYTKDPRYVARKAESFLAKSGIADVSYWGPEAEFFVFDGVRFDYQTGGGFFEIESDMANWEFGRKYDERFGPNLGYRPET